MDPIDTVTNGSQHSHGIRDGVAYIQFIHGSGSDHPGNPPQKGEAFFAIDSLDAFVADPATAAEHSPLKVLIALALPAVRGGIVCCHTHVSAPQSNSLNPGNQARVQSRSWGSPVCWFSCTARI